MRAYSLQVVEIATSGGQICVRCATEAGLGCAPGQFYLALAELPDHPLWRLPLYPFAPASGGLEFWIDSTHPYANLSPGAQLDLIGPAGQGFRLTPQTTHLLLVAPTLQRLWPLLYTALARQCALTVLFPPDVIVPPLPAEVEIQRGALTAEMVLWADLVALDLPEPQPFAHALRLLGPPRPATFVQAFIPPLMPCGTGACQACWVEVHDKLKLACVDGPVFNL